MIKYKNRKTKDAIQLWKPIVFVVIKAIFNVLKHCKNSLKNYQNVIQTIKKRVQDNADLGKC